MPEQTAEQIAAAEAKAAAKAQKEAAKAAKVKPAKVEQNGVTRPQSGSTARVWAIADEISASKKAPALRKEVTEVALAEGLVVGTINTQFGKWRKFFGLAAEPKEVAAPAAAAE